MVPHLNSVATAVPDHEVHRRFRAYAEARVTDTRVRAVFARMADRAAIDRRYSVLPPGTGADCVDAEGFYPQGCFPGTAARMRRYADGSLALAERAVAGLGASARLDEVTHVIVVSCTGFVAPGLDLLLAARLGLRPDVDRTLIGFMGCAAAIPALRTAAQAVRADPAARILVVTLELCTLHLQDTDEIEKLLSYLLFADGAAAAIVSAEPHGMALDGFRAAILPDSAGFITWTIGDSGFEMFLSGSVPGRIAEHFARGRREETLGGLLGGSEVREIGLWAVHPGGRTVLDAVETGLALPADALASSRAVLREHGNMSSATVMFVLARMLAGEGDGERGLAMAFGPGMSAETMRFRRVG